MVAALYLVMSLPLAYAVRKLALDTTDASAPAGRYRNVTSPVGKSTWIAAP